MIDLLKKAKNVRILTHGMYSTIFFRWHLSDNIYLESDN